MGIFSSLSFLRKKSSKAAERRKSHLSVEALEDRSLLSCNVISGYVFSDLNNNGLRDTGEAAIANANIQLVDANNVVIATTKTDSAGFYSFDHDPRITQTETSIEQTITYPSTQTDFTLTKLINQFDSSLGQLVGVDIYHDGTITSTIKVENTSETSPATINATVSGTIKLTGPGFTSNLDLSANAGSYSANSYDTVLDFGGNSGFTFAPKSASGSKLTTLTGTAMNAFIGTGTVSLTEQAQATSFATGGGNLVASLISNGNATVRVVYRYVPNNCLEEGDYTILLTQQPTGYFPGKLSSGGTVLNLPPGINAIPVTLQDSDLVDNDFAELLPAKISGYVYADGNDNGAKNTGEAGIGQVNLTLTGTDDLQNDISLTAQTDAAGFYQFTGLRPGSYTVTETQPTAYMDGQVSAGSAGGVVSTNQIATISINPSTQSINNNFGEVLAGSLSGYVYLDANNNGAKDAGDSGLSGVQVTLTGSNSQGAVQQTVQTDANGFYQFTSLRPGTYVISETQPTGYQNGQNSIGSQGGSTGNDQFFNILLAMGTQGVNNNFGEVQPADMMVVKTASASQVQLGETFNYTLTVSNLGTGTAQNISISDPLPAGVTYVGATGSGWSITVNGNVITATRASMASGASSVITVTVKAPLSVGNVTNVTTVTSTTPDPNLENNKSTVTVNIYNQPGQILQQDITPLVTKIALVNKSQILPGFQIYMDPALKGKLTYIDGLYRTLFNRPASSDEQKAWLAQLNAGVSQAQLMATLWSSPEHWSWEVTKIYRSILHRDPNGAELANGMASLANGGTLTNVRFAALTSASYLALHPTADSFVLGFSQDVLRIIPDSLTKLSMVQALGTTDVGTMANNLLSSSAAQDQVVISAFASVLRRMPSAADIQFWSPKLQAGQVTEQGLLQALLTSGEFYNLAFNSAT